MTDPQTVPMAAADQDDRTIARSDIDALLADLNIDGLIASLNGEPEPRPAEPSPVIVRTSNGETEERRSARRLTRSELASDIRLTIPSASEVLMINISETGALVETTRRLSPGGAADLFVRLNGCRHALRATTVRSTLHTITFKSGVVYRTALQFDKRLPLEAH